MSAASSEINTPERPGSVTRYPIAAATVIFAGIIAGLNSSGFLVPASDAAGIRVMGRAEQTVDNSAGAAGDLSADVKEGVFKWNNSGSAAVDPDDRGKIAYVEDDNTVAETGGTHKVKAGRIVDVEADGVWIDTRSGQAALVPVADTITGAADLAALKPLLVGILQGAGILK